MNLEARAEARSEAVPTAVLVFSSAGGLRSAPPPDMSALKASYLGCFAARSTTTEALQKVVRSLVLDFGVERSTLVNWAVQKGCSIGHARTLLSRIFCSLGLRERGRGAGRKPSAEAFELLAHARNRYGEQFLGVLYAACRAAKPRAEARRSRKESSGEALGLITLAQLADPKKAKRQPEPTGVNGQSHFGKQRSNSRI